MLRLKIGLMIAFVAIAGASGVFLIHKTERDEVLVCTSGREEPKSKNEYCIFFFDKPLAKEKMNVLKKMYPNIENVKVQVVNPYISLSLEPFIPHLKNEPGGYRPDDPYYKKIEEWYRLYGKHTDRSEFYKLNKASDNNINTAYYSSSHNSKIHYYIQEKEVEYYILLRTDVTFCVYAECNKTTNANFPDQYYDKRYKGHEILGLQVSKFEYDYYSKLYGSKE